MYSYQIIIKGNGGEFCLGSIPDRAGQYWEDQPKHDLIEHLCNSEACSEELVELGVNLPSWHEIDDFAHEYGIEDVERITVLDLTEKSELVADNVDPEWAAQMVNCELAISSEFENHHGYKLFTRSCEKGICTIDLSIDEPFDSSKLAMREVEFWDHTLIVGFSYAGEELSLSETFGKPYADDDCLLKAPDGSLYFE